MPDLAWRLAMGISEMVIVQWSTKLSHFKKLGGKNYF